MDRYTLDACDWPLIINEDATGWEIARFPLPDGASGDDRAGQEQLARATAVVAFLNRDDESKPRDTAAKHAVDELSREAQELGIYDDNRSTDRDN